MVTAEAIAVVYVVICYSSFVKGQDGIGSVLQKCCQLGRDAYSYSNCEANSPVSGVAPDYQSICLSAIELCCSHSKREIECTKGIKEAKIGGPCLPENSMDETGCCQACKLGLISSVLVQACDLSGTSFGKLWDSAFFNCCAPQDSGQHYSTEDPNAQRDPGKNMCLMLPNELCHHICVPSGHSYKCTCRPGWTLMSDGKSCTQMERRCMGCTDQDCVEVAGEMVCINCPRQYHLAVDNKTCIKDERGSVIPPGPGRKCPTGYRHNPYTSGNQPHCEDINECSEGLHNCNEQDEICVNTEGSYKCSTMEPAPVTCRRGFTYNPLTNSCHDVNECSQKDDPPCDSNQICVNSNGSFECQCKSGFKQDPVTLACIDINECQQHLHDCVEYQRCDNTIGSYLCVRDVNCGTGYTLNGQSGKCEDDDECVLGSHTCNLLGPEWHCLNTQGSFRCVRSKSECTSPTCTLTCPSGYKIIGSICVDIDECAEGFAKCGPNQRCTNIKGNYLCSGTVTCKSGFKLNAMNTQCIDVNECSEQEGLCSHFCDNSWGTYRCRCKPGYRLAADNRTCLDINECEEGPRCQGYCINQPGSFTCSCPPGYTSAGFRHQFCSDIDECTGHERVCNEEDVCINIAGSYRCNQIICPPGYLRDTKHRNRCQKEDTRCLNEDMECRRQPTTYTFNYMSMVSNHTIPPGGLKLFVISSSWKTTAPDFTFELIQARAPVGARAATRSDFNLKKEYGKATIELIRALEGPQEVQLEIKTEFFHGSMILATQISSLELYVSMYGF